MFDLSHPFSPAIYMTIAVVLWLVVRRWWFGSGDASDKPEKSPGRSVIIVSIAGVVSILLAGTLAAVIAYSLPD